MKCKRCGTPMKIRNGRRGRFLYCPRSTYKDSHGTISVSPWHTDLVSSNETSMFNTRSYIGGNDEV